MVVSTMMTKAARMDTTTTFWIVIFRIKKLCSWVSSLEKTSLYLVFHSFTTIFHPFFSFSNLLILALTTRFCGAKVAKNVI